MARGGGGVGPELITPEGGGGIQQIARPEHAPNYAALFSDVIRAAMEPAKFSWDMYYQGGELANKMQEMGLRGQELDETKRSNLAKEQQMALDLALRGREADETARFHRSTEQYQQGLLGNESARIKEEGRHNQATEDAASNRLLFDEDQLRSEDALRKIQGAEAAARTQETQTEYKLKQKEIDDRANDDAVIDKLADKIHSLGPRDIYNSDTNPEVKEIIQWAYGAVKTPYGHDRVTHMVGSESALGQQVERASKYADFNTAGKDAFLKRFNSNQGPERDETYQQKWDAAFDAGKYANDNENELRKMTGAGRMAYDSAIHTRKPDGTPTTVEEAMGAARTAQLLAEKNAKTKGMPWREKEIADAAKEVGNGDGQLILRTGEDPASEAFQLRASRVRRDAQSAVMNEENPQEVFDKENQATSMFNSSKGTTGPETTAADQKKALETAAGKLKPQLPVTTPTPSPAPKPAPIPVATPAPTPAQPSAQTTDTTAGWSSSPWTWLYSNLTPKYATGEVQPKTLQQNIQGIGQTGQAIGTAVGKPVMAEGQNIFEDLRQSLFGR
jgi:hypothetical protein